MDIDPGTVVANRYRISRPLGRGGMGEVFAAENIRTGRPVAVKLLRSDTKTKSSAVARFRQEARAAGSINSDHVTQVLDVEEDAEHGVVLVFELLEGESLIDRLKRTGPISMEELHPIIDQVWMGLADAHRVGIVHRDLKPSNVFLEHRPDGTTRVKILDFGISKIPKEIGGETLTEMGQSLGTFSFMPPEQIGKAKTVDHRADIYACATMIYQSLSGQLPYSARNILVMVEMKAKTDGRKLAEVMGAPVDPRLEGFLAQGLARDPAHRFQTANEALAAWRELRPTSRTPTLDPSSSPRPISSNRSVNDSGVHARPHAPETPLPQIQPLPIIDMSTDTAATVSMPNPNIAHLSNPTSAANQGARAAEVPPRVDPRMDAQLVGAPTRPIGLGGTQPVIVGRMPGAPSQVGRQTGSGLSAAGQAGSLPLPPRSPNTAQVMIERPADLKQIRPEELSGSYDEPPRTGNLQPHPAGYYIPPDVAASLAAQARQSAGQNAQSGPHPGQALAQQGNPATTSQSNLAKLMDDPTSLPASSTERTTVYRPQGRPDQARTDQARTDSGRFDVARADVARLRPPEAPPKRGISWTVVLICMACVLGGFVAVTAYMVFIRH